ncbi:hypothetical protein [Nonomuraea soli]|uniref:Uncharacterized protein n=1 Tax=Nonomuraea soli TaxID=1032476 RepID=A0A7W0CUC1_9ACTN|nr:hypothetical protein [Nonomuraea soli]MBA2897387.1 hypothetical protein [Nonomuraea soli]
MSKADDRAAEARLNERQHYAQKLGMKVSEILSVQVDDERALVTTHDGQRVLVTDDGVFPYDDAQPVAAPATDETAVDNPAGPIEPAVDGAMTNAAGSRSDTSGSSPAVDGTIEQIMTWVDGDAERAREALSGELAKAKPRPSLVAQLQKILDGQEDGQGQGEGE